MHSTLSPAINIFINVRKLKLDLLVPYSQIGGPGFDPHRHPKVFLRPFPIFIAQIRLIWCIQLYNVIQFL